MHVLVIFLYIDCKLCCKNTNVCVFVVRSISCLNHLTITVEPAEVALNSLAHCSEKSLFVVDFNQNYFFCLFVVATIVKPSQSIDTRALLLSA